MSTWKLIAEEQLDVPVRSAGNQVYNIPVSFEIYQDTTEFKAVPLCSKEEKIKANLKDEIFFAFQVHRAVAAGGIKDGNQHIVERLGALLKEKEKAA